jgi:hypothetical protein
MLKHILVTLAAAVSFGATLSQAQLVTFYVGQDGQTTLPSGTHKNLPNPNGGRLTFLYAHQFLASGNRRAGNTPIASAPTDWCFDVVPPPPPVLGLTHAADGTLQLTLQAQPGLNYILERTVTFTDWTVLTHLHAATPLTLHPLPAGPAPFEFWRARLR